MKTSLLILVIIFIPIVAFAQPQLSFESTTIEYDQIKVGSNGERSFKFQNSGDEILHINRIVSTSSHLQVICPAEDIRPGGTGQVILKYDTDIPGPIRRTVTIYSNAKNHPVLALKVKGQVFEKEASKN